MKILAIETSCDDTCIAIIKSKIQNPKSKIIVVNFEILSNIVSSQVKLHAKYGGVYPFMAKREHQKNLPIVLKKALEKANFSISNSEFLISKKNPNVKIQMSKIDLVAVTVGPGLEPCLWVGINFAKDLAKKLNLPLVPVNHIEAHILANFIDDESEISPPPLFKRKYIPKRPLTKSGGGQNSKLFPAICLVVSGGHTQLILMKNVGNYKILGETRDDAAGECFDKTARILGLGYPGGPAIAQYAAQWKSKKLASRGHSSVSLPRPMIYQKNYDFSFSGLKTAVLYLVKQLTINNKRLTISQKREICAETQQAVIDVLIHKILRAAKDYKVKTIILGGGVAANKELRKQFKQKIKKEIPNSLFLIPDSKFCTDNAAMVAAAAYFNWKKEEKTKPENEEEDKSSSSPTEALAEVKKRTKFSSPFAGTRVIEANANLRL